MGTSRDKLYSELGLESLDDRQFYRGLIAFDKIVNNKAPQYSIDYLPTQDLASTNLSKRPAIYPLDAGTNVITILFFLTVSHNGTIWIVVQEISHLLLLSNLLFLIF